MGTHPIVNASETNLKLLFSLGVNTPTHPPKILVLVILGYYHWVLGFEGHNFIVNPS